MKCKLPRTPLNEIGKGSKSLGQKPVQPLQKLADRNIKDTNPLKEQFAPNETSLLPQHKAMAGMS